MTRRALAIALAALAVLPATASAAAPPPAYMQLPEVRAAIDAAGLQGLSLQQINQLIVTRGLSGPGDEPVVAEPCVTQEPNTDVGAVHTNACITYPSGCTANFIYSSTTQNEVADGRNHFIGTAGHCVSRSNEPVYMETGDSIVKRVGVVAKHVNGGIGNDMALIRIDEGFELDPEMPGFPGTPQGVYAGCEGGQSLSWWGHGFGVAVGQGQKGSGLDAQWFDRQFAWTGDALPGDSGSGIIVDETGQAAGDLTHLVIDTGRYGENINAGTRMTHVLAWAGNLKLVNADGTLADAPRRTRCGNANNGG